MQRDGVFMERLKPVVCTNVLGHEVLSERAHLCVHLLIQFGPVCTGNVLLVHVSTTAFFFNGLPSGLVLGGLH